MTKVAEEEMNSMDNNISECKVVYMPQVLHCFHHSSHVNLRHLSVQ